MSICNLILMCIIEAFLHRCFVFWIFDFYCKCLGWMKLHLSYSCYLLSTADLKKNKILSPLLKMKTKKIAKLSTFNGHVSHFTSGIYDWAFLYSLNYKSVFSPPQALVTMLQVVRLIKSIHNSTKMNYSLYKACTRITM